MDAITKSRENRDFTKGNLLKKIIIYLIPLFLANALQLFFTTMDLITVTQFGNGNISSGAIGATNNLINLILCTFWGVTGGASVVIANARGSYDIDKIKRAIGSSTLLMFFAGLIVMFFGLRFSKDLLIALETKPEFLEKSTEYVSIFFLGSVFNLLYNMGAGILRALGDTKRPFIAVVISGVINIGLNFLFVIAFKWDVKGVAIATITSQAIAMLVVYFFLMKDKRLVANFEFKYLRIYASETKDILRLGIANGLQGFIFNFTNVNIQKCTNIIGPEATIGKAAASNVEGYQYGLLNAISNTCLVAVSQNYGAKKKERMTHSLLLTIALEAVLVTSFDLMLILFSKPLLSLFIASGESTTELATELAIRSLIIMGVPYALCGIAECFAFFLRGMKYAVVPTVVSLLCIVGIRMFYIYFLFDIEFFHTFDWVFILYPITWTVCCLVYIPICIFLGKHKFKQLDLENLYEAE